MNKNFTIAVAAGLAIGVGGFASQAAAQDGISYDYAEGGLWMQSSDDQDMTGLFANGSLSFTDDIFGVAGFGLLSDDSDYTFLSAGAGYRFGVMPEMDVYGTFTLEHFDYDVDSDAGFGIAGGARYDLGPDMELGGELKHTSIGGDFDDNWLTLAGTFLYSFTPELEGVGRVQIFDFADENELGFQVGARYNF